MKRDEEDFAWRLHLIFAVTIASAPFAALVIGAVVKLITGAPF